MGQDLQTTGGDPRDQEQPRGAIEVFAPRLPANRDINAGAVAIESERAIAEVQGKIYIAQKFKRNVHQARADFLEACASYEFAQEAFYTVPNRGHGPSIRFAEELARCYGNFEYGHRELSRGDGKSEIEVYAWDMEKNNHSKRQITVMHVRDTKGGATPLKDQTDIDNRVANVASKQMRGRILALVPKALVAEGKAAAKRTLAAGGNGEKTIQQRVAAMTTVFGKVGVTVAHLETYLGHPLADVTDDELADFHGIYNAIKEGAKASDYFGEKADGKETSDRGAALKNQIESDGAKKEAPKADAKKEPAKEPAKDAVKKDQPKADPKAAAADPEEKQVAKPAAARRQPAAAAQAEPPAAQEAEPAADDEDEDAF